MNENWWIQQGTFLYTYFLFHPSTSPSFFTTISYHILSASRASKCFKNHQTDANHNLRSNKEKPTHVNRTLITNFILHQTQSSTHYHHAKIPRITISHIIISIKIKSPANNNPRQQLIRHYYIITTTIIIITKSSHQI